jgi:protoheme IX farnesyltransferase
MVLCFTALIGVASAGDALDAGRLALAVAAMLFSQLAIGWTNDYVDRDIDAVHQPSKPIPSGLVDITVLRPAIVLVVIVSLVLGALLGPWTLALLVIGTAAGLAYDLRLKDTPWSMQAFVVAFAVLPPFVWTALDVYRDEFAWLYVIGAPLAVAAHIANVLPDLETDAVAGRRNLVVALGARGSFGLLWLCLLSAPVLAYITTSAYEPYDQALLAATAGVYLLLVSSAPVAYRRPGRQGRVWGFRFVVLASVLFAGGWLAAV